MTLNIRKILLISLGFYGTALVAKEPKTSVKVKDIEFKVSGKLDTVTTSDLYASLLNHGVHNDKTIATKTTADVVFDVNSKSTKLRLSPRAKAVWGNDKQLTTKSADLKDVHAVSLGHSHKIPARMIWMREAWAELNLTEIFGMDIPKQTFTIGSFPFSLGRGIVLGDAYSVSPASLGFYSDASVDQYAFGAKFSGDLRKDFISYDLYTAVLENKSTSISETSEQTLAQAFGKKSDPARGFGKINWVGAARLNITPLDVDGTKLKLEPYIMHNSAPEQMVEFASDASSKLTTFGAAADFTWNRFELNLEGALNTGKQKVLGWDRNRIEKLNRGGYVVFAYSNIYDTDPNTTTVTDANKVLYDTSNSAQVSAINAVNRSESSNGTLVAGTAVYNGLTRFRAPYENKYKGFMAVADLGYWVYKNDLKVAVAGGIASGDRNPNVNLADPLEPKIDGTYEGFLGLQEVYGGKQVVSAFVMGAGKLVRPLSAPNSGDQFADVVNGFNNLRFGGVSCKYEPKDRARKLKINPNLLAYWQDDATNKFDLTTGLSSAELANKFLGTELNLIVAVGLTEDVTANFSGAVFFPGKHYDDIKGKPFNAAQRKALDAANLTSIPSNLPVISSDRAYSINLGLCYAF